MRCVLVTGATGFIGSELVSELQSGGDEVHALVRGNADRDIPGSSAVHWHVGDLTDVVSITRAVAAARRRADELGTDLFAVHSAAVISYRTGDRELQQRVNVEGTLAFVDACHKTGVKRIVHVSSVVAVGVADNADEELNEDADFNGDRLRCDYVDTKRNAELAALSYQGELEIVVVNPGAVYGSGRSLTNTSRFLKTLLLHPAVGRMAPPGSLSAVGVKDVAAGIVRALERGQPGRRYLLTESNLQLNQLYTRVLELGGNSSQVLTLPTVFWRALVSVCGGLDRIRRVEFATPQALGLLGVHFRFSSKRAREELGWQPTPFDEVLRETLTWLKTDPSLR